MRDRWPRTGIESLGLAVDGVCGALEILRLVECLTSRQCLRYKLCEHSVANQYFLQQFFFLQTNLSLSNSLSSMTTILNMSNNSTRITGFSVTQNIRKLFLRNFRKERYCGDTLSILCAKIFEANCANILGNYDSLETWTKLDYLLKK